VTWLGGQSCSGDGGSRGSSGAVRRLRAPAVPGGPHCSGLPRRPRGQPPGHQAADTGRRAPRTRVIPRR